jgi:hypothetical protein
MTTGALFTIGYEGRTQDEYLGLLTGAGVTLLADVRRNPISRKKGFSRKALAEGCAAVGVRYEHLPELGIASEKRKNANKEHMGLHTWTDAPLGKIQKFDVVVAKNYLTESELAQLTRLVNAYLDVAEDMALRKMPMTMQDWETRLNRFLAATDREVLQDAGKVTAEIAKAHAESEFEKYRIVQERLFESDFDRVVAETKRLAAANPAPRTAHSSRDEGEDAP